MSRPNVRRQSILSGVRQGNCFVDRVKSSGAQHRAKNLFLSDLGIRPHFLQQRGFKETPARRLQKRLAASDQLRALAEPLVKSGYGKYLLNLLAAH